MSVIGCQGSQDSCILTRMPGGLPATMSSGPLWVFFSSCFESVDRCYLHLTLRTVSRLPSYVFGDSVAEVCITILLCHALVQAFDNTVAVTVTTTVAVLQSGVTVTVTSRSLLEQ